MNNTIKQLFERKSVRVYQDKLIEAKEKQLIFNAAIQAPTAGNMTLYSIIDIQDIKNGMMHLNIIMVKNRCVRHHMVIFY